MSGITGPGALDWSAFGRRLTLAFGLLTVLLGAGMTLLSALRARTLLELSLAQRGEAIADGAARASFVPLSLEDREALAYIAAGYEAQGSLASLRILDEHGKVWASFQRAGAPSAGLLEVSTPIRVPHAPESPPIGMVELRMDPGDARAAVRRQVRLILFFNGLFGGLVLAAGLWLVSRLTRGMHELAREAARAEDLSRSNRELEEFAYIASHDLQAPLRRITGFAQLLSDRYKGRLDEEADDYIARINASTMRMQGLIQDLLTYSRAGSKQLEPVRTDCAKVLRDVLADLETTIRDAGAKVTAGPLPVVTADPGQLSRLLQNLIGNAVKFRAADRPAVVRVSARRDGREWVFAVADNGIGIEPKFTADVFKMFRRLHPATAYPGTGIGLAVSRKIVERHGGRIWVESEPGRGATFYFTLGAARAPGTEA
jgi:signal transduction histidine kinase